MTIRRTEQLLFQSFSSLYEHSDTTASTLITSILKHKSQIYNDEQDINNEFIIFYSSLYTSEVVHDPSTLD